MYDEKDIIETPENVYLERELGGIGSRFAAFFMDYLLLTLAGIALVIVMSIFTQVWPDELLRSGLDKRV